MILLKNTSSTVEVTTSSTASLDYSASYVDVTTTTFDPSSNEGNISTATTTQIVAAPAASTQRQVKLITLRNKSTTAAQVVTVKKDISGTEYSLTPAVTLAPGECMQYTDGDGWSVLDSAGQKKTTQNKTSGITGNTCALYKAGTGADTVGYWYCTAKDSGFPGAFAPGTPGVNGRAVTYEAGALTLPTVGAGTLFLTNSTLTSTVSHWNLIFDLLWINTALVVTTTTEQTFTTPTLPSRDIDGTVNGKGCIIGMLTTTANTNAAAIANATVRYTNAAGTGSRTARLVANVGAQITVSPVIGTITWFTLDTGDDGVKSIEGVTLGTSLAAGAISMIIARPVIGIPVTLPNVGTNIDTDAPGIKIFANSCLLHCYQASATTATTFAGSFTFQEK